MADQRAAAIDRVAPAALPASPPAFFAAAAAIAAAAVAVAAVAAPEVATRGAAPYAWGPTDRSPSGPERCGDGCDCSCASCCA